MLRLARFAGQLIVSEFIYITALGFFCDLFQYRARENFGTEHRGNLFFADLIDQPHDFFGARVGKVGWLHGADHLETITAGKVRPGIVIGEQAAIVGRDRLDRFLDRLIERFNILRESRSVLLVRLLVLRIEAN